MTYLTVSATITGMKWYKITFVVVGVLFLFVSLVDLSLGCPPPPFAHKCLMKQAGVLPPYR